MTIGEIKTPFIKKNMEEIVLNLVIIALRICQTVIYILLCICH